MLKKEMQQLKQYIIFLNKMQVEKLEKLENLEKLEKLEKPEKPEKPEIQNLNYDEEEDNKKIIIIDIIFDYTKKIFITFTMVYFIFKII